MIETAIILSMAFTAAFLIWSGFKLAEDHYWIKILFISVGFIFLIGTTFTGYMFALNGASSGDIYQEVSSVSYTLGENGRSVDAYGQQVTKNTRNLLNLPSHNPYNRESWRVAINDTFRNLQYNDYKEYKKLPDVHKLMPAQGGKVTFESTESPPYVVHYELWYSWAANINRTLQTGDVVRFGAFTDENGYFFKMNSTSGTDQGYMMVRRNGTNTKAELVDLEESFTEFTRFELRSNWYNVGEQVWVQTTANSSREDVQQNNILGYTAPNGERTNGPELQQLPIRFEVERGATSSPLALFAGSTNVVVAGAVNPVRRGKTGRFTETVSTPDQWEPIYALRINPDNDFVKVELADVDLTEISTNTDFFVTAQSHDPDLVLSDSGDPINTEGTGWSPPAPLSSTNNAIQVTSNISQAPNGTGTPVTATDEIGGFQVGWGSLYSTGNKGDAGSSSSQAVQRPVFGSDVVVMWAKGQDEGNSSFPADVSVEYVTEQTY